MDAARMPKEKQPENGNFVMKLKYIMYSRFDTQASKIKTISHLFNAYKLTSFKTL